LIDSKYPINLRSNGYKRLLGHLYVQTHIACNVYHQLDINVFRTITISCRLSSYMFWCVSMVRAKDDYVWIY